MKKKLALILSAALAAAALTACSSDSQTETSAADAEAVSAEVSDAAEVAADAADTDTADADAAAGNENAADSEQAESTAEPTVTEVELSSGTVTVYDYGIEKLHVYYTGDALGDVAYIVEGADALVGIELPSFTDGLDSYTAYISELGKPMNDIFVADHATGASYVEGMNVYGTEGAADSIKDGETFATTDGLYQTFGDDFHGGDDMVQINQIIPAGSITVGGIEFNVIDRGYTYDLEIPSINAVYTHMLGKTSHSILTGVNQMNELIDILKGYQTAGYDMILSAHSGVEGQDAVTEKIAYVEKALELADSSADAASFTAAMNEAFPDHDSANYLEMTAGYLFPEN